MKKIEYIWRELLFRSIEKHDPEFSISELAKKFSLSTSVVSHALVPLRELRMVEIGKFHSKVVDCEKLLFFWATRRRLNKDIIYKTYSPLSVFEREASFPAEVTPTAYSAYRMYFEDNPADYDVIYFYSQKADAIKMRFPPEEKKKANIYILKEDSFLACYKRIPIGQVFADLWNLPEWYSRDFSNALLVKIKEKIGL